MGRTAATLLLLLLQGLLSQHAAQDLDAWDRVLATHVRPGQIEGVTVNVVDYAGLKADPDFTHFVESLETAPAPTTRDEAYALFMNAYNALAMNLVAQHGCLGGVGIMSIVDIGKQLAGAPSVWAMHAGTVAGTPYSLQQIEDYLRNPAPWAIDPRLHACIVCASVSCPDVALQAFRAPTVQAQMEAQMRALLANPQKGFALNQQAGVMTLTRVFKWYGGDFAKARGSVLDFLLPLLPSATDRAYIAANRAHLVTAYFPWNRHLNGPAPCAQVNPVRQLQV